MSLLGTDGLGPLAHVAHAVDDVTAAMRAFDRLGVRWSSLRHPVARLEDPEGGITEVGVDYVASSGGEPRLKLLTAVRGSVFGVRGSSPVHHVSYWVEELDSPTAGLREEGWQVEATGLGESGRAEYRYLISPDGRRIELGLLSGRAAFDEWAEGSGERFTDSRQSCAG